GTDRYQTAVEISRAGWVKAETVVLARGNDFADALTGVPLAYKLDCPILLTSPNGLNPETKAELGRLKTKKVIILGGEQAVSKNVKNELEALGLEVVRIPGGNRYETASLISQMLAPQGATKAVIAYGNNFPDALAAASYAAIEGLPILLTETNVLPSATQEALNRLGVTQTIVVGGISAVGENVFKALPAPVRVSGSNRYATSVALAEHFKPTSEHMYFASGLDFPDAVTGAVLAAKENSGMLLVRNNRIPGEVEEYIAGFKEVDDIAKLFSVEEEPEYILSSELTVNHKVMSGKVYGLDYGGNLVYLTESPSFLPAGDYWVDIANNDYTFYQFTSQGLDNRGYFYYLEHIPYTLLPLDRPADPKVTASFIEQQSKKVSSNTAFVGSVAEAFLKSQETWGVNALYLLGHAALESSWGTSNFAQHRNNLFGYGAYTSDPDKAYIYRTKEDCVLWIGGVVRRNYLTEGAVFCNGINLVGMNQKYADDPMWAVKIATIMERILPYSQYKLVNKEYNRGRVTASSLSLRSGPGVNYNRVRTLFQGAELKITSMILRSGSSCGDSSVTSERWFKVEVGQDCGWVCGSYVELIDHPNGAVFIPDWRLDENVALGVYGQ
ncbi:MAG: cell wall-binding repeat-containing protein, partial [Candidatus Contubernalis sp.]|nr:cell wall-binding repeat-containing protein [Candidatus Contubernalis sp.]